MQSQELCGKNRGKTFHIIDYSGRFVYTSGMSIRKDDQVSVLNAVNKVVLVLLREGVDDGFHAFTASRKIDAKIFPQYSDCTRMNMLYDRIAASTRQLVDAAAPDIPDIWWKITENKRATDVLLGERFAFRIKRTKRNRGGCTTSVATRRQRAIKSAVTPVPSQMVLPFSVMLNTVPDEERIWLTVGYDLDDAEESLESVTIGIELRKSFLWKIPLPVPDTDVIATLSPSLADKIAGMRAHRSA